MLVHSRRQGLFKSSLQMADIIPFRCISSSSSTSSSPYPPRRRDVSSSFSNSSPVAGRYRSRPLLVSLRLLSFSSGSAGVASPLSSRPVPSVIQNMQNARQFAFLQMGNSYNSRQYNCEYRIRRINFASRSCRYSSFFPYVV